MQYFIGVDVGTGSVRAALVRADGKLVCHAARDIQIWNPRPNFYQQSTTNIWEAVIETVKSVCKTGGVSAEDVSGLGFDATCSLVVADQQCRPLSVCPDGVGECDIIMWMDHRATVETDLINATKHRVLKYTGGTISLEMEPPKLLWLKKNLSESCWDKAGHFFDLCDFLTWRATGSFTRSLCSVVAKWTYTADSKFDATFFTQVGLEDLCENDFQKIGCDIQPQGTPCGSGLTAEAAAELGLKPGTAVGVGMIDAHSGCIGCFGCEPRDSCLASVPLKSKMAMICGTSTCHMALSAEAQFIPGVWGPLWSSVVPDMWTTEGGQSAAGKLLSEEDIFVPGVWGPLWSAVIPGMWVAEGGQSAAGKLIDFVIETHPAYSDALKAAQEKSQHICDHLLSLLQQEAGNQGLAGVAQLTRDLHVWPDYHGNRSPLADHTLKGMVSGLTLQNDSLSLALLYLATVQALAYSTRHIVSTLIECGHATKMVYMCGGLRKNSLYVQCHADITGMPVVIPDEKESVLLGAAILGATAAGLHPSVQGCMDHMCGQGNVTLPDTNDTQYHEKKYRVFLEMFKHQRQYQSIMQDTS